MFLSFLKINNTQFIFLLLITLLAFGCNPEMKETLIKMENVKSTYLDARNVDIWLPPSYYADEENQYPVLYMHDGQNIIDPQTAMFGIDWQIDETADSLITNNEIEPVIIVGIYNTTDRAAEYQDTDTTRVYMKLVVDVIKPLIDQTYRTRPERIHTSTGGASSGGLISFILLWEYPQFFSKAACLSPAFKIDQIDYVSRVKNSPPAPKNIRIYIDNGDVSLDQQLQPGIDEMINALEKKGLIRGIDFQWYLAQNNNHNESAWAQRVWRFLRYFYPAQGK